MYALCVTKEPKTGKTSARLTTTGRALMDAISIKLGVSDAAVIEMTLREYAERHGIQPLYTEPAKKDA
jgi:hypothetical protein